VAPARRGECGRISHGSPFCDQRQLVVLSISTTVKVRVAYRDVKRLLWRCVVSRCSPFDVELCGEVRTVLERRASSRCEPHAIVVRARIVLLAADGARNVDISEQVGVCVDVVSKWRKRFCLRGLAGLKDLPRAGRPRTFGSEVVAGVKALACEPPEQRCVPLSRWSSHELAAQEVSEGLVDAISSSTVHRWLHADAIKPWRYRSWIFPRDPNFADNAARVLDSTPARLKAWRGVRTTT